MSFEKTMLAIAMESGEVLPEETMGYEVDSDEVFDELLYATEARADELMNALKFAESLESLSHNGGEAFTQESFESYQGKLNHLMAVHGVEIPLGTLAPSFEAATADAGAVKQKSAGVISKLIAWLKEKWEAFVKALGRLNIFARMRAKKVKDDQAAIEAHWKGNEHTNVDQSAFVRGHHPQLTMFVAGGKLQSSLVIQELDKEPTEDHGNVLSFKDQKGNLLINEHSFINSEALIQTNENLIKYIEADPAPKLIEEAKARFLHGPTTTDYEYRPDQILELTKHVSDKVQWFEGMVAHFAKITADLEKSLLNDASKAKDAHEALLFRGVSTRAMTVGQRIVALVSTEQSGHIRVYNDLKALIGIKSVKTSAPA